MRKYLKMAVVIGAVVFLLIQAWRPDRTNPPVVTSHRMEAQLDVPQNVEAILSRACADCHSNGTHWPWYTNVSPVSWFVAGHIQGGRSHMNFSEWDSVKTQTWWKRNGLQQICTEIQSGGMPLTSYLLIHWNAKLSSEDVRIVCEWTELARQQTQTGSATGADTTPK